MTAYVVFIMVLLFAVPQIIDKYTDAFSGIRYEDYLLLANVKEEKSDYSSAIVYLEKYKSSSTDTEFNKKIVEKIRSLKELQLERPD